MAGNSFLKLIPAIKMCKDSLKQQNCTIMFGIQLIPERLGKVFQVLMLCRQKKFGNCLFKKIEIFARPYRANVGMGNGHEMFLTLILTTTQIVKMSVTK